MMISHRSRKALEQRAVERLVLKLIGDPPDIFLSDSIVARLTVGTLGHS
jgi:hypothetical protein